ncbi:hypothetical protein [Thermoanaerobacterium sp. RBIITD]|uniref:hypothetical protein n=1 Tax=Thermoanaerobacterium sp. RBIITD TaxID=1550240 RepID=UPI000BB79768|nr:hypothetical protein [Thermoanaerobacterium sp. RBIITD]SNX52902.1 hypothetical protein SAMN05660242_0366 [Thermoanaerobacterium sp. RBIITD]
MIICNNSDINNYLIKELSPFRNTGKYLIIIIDPYYYDKSAKNKINIDNFINFLKLDINITRIIWFCSRFYNNHSNKDVEVKIFTHIELHDRFLFVYDISKKIYVKIIHIGASINSFNINDKVGMNNNVSIFRISNVDEINLNDNKDQNYKIINIIENLYNKKDWGY